jgi:hypothetical protein
MMKTLPNNVTVFNATPHNITFQCPMCEGAEYDAERGYLCPGCDGAEVIVVTSDEVISASIEEMAMGSRKYSGSLVEFVRPEFVANKAGLKTIEAATAAGADVIIGSVIAAQAYPGKVMAMVPALGFERVPPAQKRMRTNKFTCFPYEGKNG